jgi:hypothetical protein
MPPRVSRIEERERLTPANRNGTTGRMQGLRTVNMPPRKAMRNMDVTLKMVVRIRNPPLTLTLSPEGRGD